MEQATKTPWTISIPWLPGKHIALISPKTIHSGDFMVEMNNVSGERYPRLYWSVLSIKKPPHKREAFVTQSVESTSSLWLIGK